MFCTLKSVSKDYKGHVQVTLSLSLSPFLEQWQQNLLSSHMQQKSHAGVRVWGPSVTPPKSVCVPHQVREDPPAARQILTGKAQDQSSEEHGEPCLPGVTAGTDQESTKSLSPLPGPHAQSLARVQCTVLQNLESVDQTHSPPQPRYTHPCLSMSQSVSGEWKIHVVSPVEDRVCRPEKGGG